VQIQIIVILHLSILLHVTQFLSSVNLTFIYMYFKDITLCSLNLLLNWSKSEFNVIIIYIFVLLFVSAVLLSLFDNGNENRHTHVKINIVFRGNFLI